MNITPSLYLRIVVLLSLCSAFHLATAQSGPVCGTDVVLETQAQVDAFNCTQVRSLTLAVGFDEPDPITDLSNLSSLVTIEQDLTSVRC